MREKLEKYLNNTWYSEESSPLLLRLLSKLFDLFRRFRLFLYTRQWFNSLKGPVPIIVVGNITVGGTGKSPIVLFLIDSLQREGFAVGVVSRGYGGSLGKKKCVLVDQNHTADQIGDEAFMIYQRNKVAFAIGRKRAQAALLLMREHPELNVIISDDGLQHYNMQRSVEFVVVDGQRGFGNMQLIPSGPLREPVARLESVDGVFINGKATHASLNEIESQQFNLVPAYFRKLNSVNETREIQAFFAKKVHAFAGIGNPDRFYKLLRSLGLEVIEHSISDHARMPDSFFSNFSDELIVMTEKDAVKYPNVVTGDVWYLPVTVQFLDSSFDPVDIVIKKIGDMK